MKIITHLKFLLRYKKELILKLHYNDTSYEYYSSADIPLSFYKKYRNLLLGIIYPPRALYYKNKKLIFSQGALINYYFKYVDLPEFTNVRWSHTFIALEELSESTKSRILYRCGLLCAIKQPKINQLVKIRLIHVIQIYERKQSWKLVDYNIIRQIYRYLPNNNESNLVSYPVLIS